MKQPIAVGDCTAQPGELAFGRIPGVMQPDSTSADLPVLVLNGAFDGPILWLNAALHGTEITGSAAIIHLMREKLDPTELKGAVIGTPIGNPLAYRLHAWRTPQDFTNINRVFPGNREGTTSEQAAYLLFSEIQRHVNYLIDFHANPEPAVMFSIVVTSERISPAVKERSLEMAKAFGLTTIQIKGPEVGHHGGSLSEAAAHANIPNITVELLAWRRIKPEGLAAAEIGTLNVMKQLGMIDGPLQLQKTIEIDGSLTRAIVIAKKGGLVFYAKEAGDAVRKGEVIAEIRNPYGDLVEEVTSPVDGYLLAYPMIWNQAATSGDMIAFIAHQA